MLCQWTDLGHNKGDQQYLLNTPADMSTCEYSLSAIDKGLSLAAWKTNPEFRNTLSVLRFCGGPVNSLWSNTSSGVTAQNSCT